MNSIVRRGRQGGLWLVCSLLFILLLWNPSAGKVFPNEDYEEWQYDTNHNRIDDRLEIKADMPAVDAVILFNRCLDPYDATFVANFATVEYVAQHVQAIYVSGADVSALTGMLGDPYGSINIFRVEMVQLGTYTLNVSNPAVRARESLTYSPNTAWDQGQNGAGVTIALLDSGVDDGHPALAGKYVGGYDAELDQPINPDDVLGHGTHVAGISVGLDPSGVYSGVAAGANLADVKVGTWAPSPVSHARAIDWCINNRVALGIRVLNMSYRFDMDSDGKDVSSMYVDRAVDAGLVVCIAVGNEGQDDNIPSPAAADRSIAVAALNDMGSMSRNDDTHVGFSNRGPRDTDNDDDTIDEEKPDVIAPGMDIMSAEHAVVGQSPANTYVSKSGTSMASPHVAGVAAILIGSDPSLEADDVKAILRSTSTDQAQNENPAWTDTWGKGEVDAYRSLCTNKPSADLYVRSWVHDIYTPSDPPQAGVTTTLYARVRNYGPNAANGVAVLFLTNRNNLGYSGWTQIGQDVVNVPSGGMTVASIPWTPLAGHQCIRAKAVYCNDPDHSNDRGQENFDPHPSTFLIEAGAPLPYPHDILVTIAADSIQTDSGWSIEMTAEDGSFEPLFIEEPGAYQVQIHRDGETCPCIIRVEMNHPGDCSTPGDANHDYAVNVGDAVFLIAYIFKGGPAPECEGAYSPLYLAGYVNDSLLARQTILTYECVSGDVNDDRDVNVGDAVFLINYVFKGGPPPTCGKPYVY